MSRSFTATCQECGTSRLVRRVELLRAAKPRCRKCGGVLELSQAAQDDLAKIQANKQGKDYRPKKKEPAPEPARIIPVKEMARFEWAQWPHLYNWGRKHLGPDVYEIFTPSQFYNDARVLDYYSGDSREKGMPLVLTTEGSHLRFGQTYYKVWPNIAEALCHTEMRIEGKNLRLPQPAFEVRFPLGHSPCFPFETALVTETFDADRGKRRLVVITMTNVRDFDRVWDGGSYCGGSLEIGDDELLEDCLDRFMTIVNPDFDEATRRLIRVVIGVTFFGQDRHEMVLPDLPRRVIERYQRERRQPAPGEAERLVEAARQDGFTGFKIGSEIDLPTAVRRPEGPEGVVLHGRELTAGHVRRGHLRMQACGPKLQGHKVVFVPPCVVRPDLPLQTTHGYRVRAPKESAWTPQLEES